MTTTATFQPGDIVEVRTGAAKGQLAKVHSMRADGRVTVRLANGQGWTYAARSLKLVATPAIIAADHAAALAENAARIQVQAWNARHGLWPESPAGDIAARIDADHAAALAENRNRAMDLRAQQTNAWRASHALAGTPATDNARREADHAAAMDENVARNARTSAVSRATARRRAAEPIGASLHTIAARLGFELRTVAGRMPYEAYDAGTYNMRMNFADLGRLAAWLDSHDAARHDAAPAFGVFPNGIGRPAAVVAPQLNRSALNREVTTETTDNPTTRVMSSDDVRITMGHDQAAKLAELMARHIDLDVVRLDNDDPNGAQFVTDFIAALHSALDD